MMSEEKSFKNESEDATKCDCGENGCLGVCPYAEEIGGSIIECTCCSNCRGECADAI